VLKSECAGRAIALAATIVAGFTLLYAILHYERDRSLGLEWLAGESGNPLYRAQRLNEGALLYRDVACQYGPTPVYFYAIYARFFGNTVGSLIVFQRLVQTISVVLLLLLLCRVAGIGTALLMMLWFGFAFANASFHVEFGGFERICLIILMILWNPPTLRSWQRSTVLGLVLGLWQTAKFGGPFYALLALGLADAVCLWVGRGDRLAWRAAGRSLLVTCLTFLACEAAWAVVASLVLPSAVARDTLWPDFMASDYPPVWQDVPRNWQQLRLLLLKMWTTVVCTGFAFAGLAVFLRQQASSKGVEVDCRHLLGLGFVLLGLGTYLPGVNHVYAFSWALLPAVAWLVSRFSLKHQIVFYLAFAIAPAYLVKESLFPRSPGSELVAVGLPDSEDLLVERAEAVDLTLLSNAMGVVDKSRNEFAVGFFRYGGGGFHYFYNANYGLRNHMVGTASFRSYDEEELEAKLDRVPVFVFVTQHATADEARLMVFRSLSANLADRIANEYRFSPELSGGHIAVMVRA
jgi:hypothetical protein